MSKGLGPKVISLLIVVLMLGCGLGSVVPNWRSGVSATTIPPTFSTDWTVSTALRYDGGSSVLTGNLTVQSGGNLILNNLTLSLAGAFSGQYHVDIKAGGTLRVFNSTIKANAANRMQWLHSNGTLEILNSTVRDFGLTKKFDGVNIMGGSARLIKDIFTSNDLGLRIANIHPTIENCTVFSSLDAGLVVNLTSVTAWGMSISDNDAVSGFGGGVWVGAGARLILRNSTVTYNYVNGIAMQDGGTVELYNSTNVHNPLDYYIGYSSLQTNLSYYNTPHWNGALFGPGTMTPLVHLRNYFYVNISATWESDDGPVAGGNYKIFNKTMVKSFDGPLDSNGMHRYIPVLESELTNVKNTSFNPYAFNVSGQRNSKDHYSGFNSTIDMNKNLHFYLDDKPPTLQIIAPANNTATNNTQIDLKCMTEPGAKAFINNIPVTVDDFGYFKATYYLLVEGPNYIHIEARDEQGNSRIIILNITRDTTPPVIKLTAPVQGAFYNSTAVQVIGSTEPGDTVKMNGYYTPILADGSFNLTLTMLDGPNTLTVKSSDKVGNSATLSVSFTVDLLLPYLKVHEPTDWSGTRNSTAHVSGSTEIGANLTVNGEPIVLTGTGFNTTADLKEGLNLITIKACDKANNCAQKTVHVTKDSIAPKLNVTVPPSTKEALTNNAEFTVKGSTEPGAKLTVNGQETPTSMTGNFSQIVSLKEGLNTISIKSQDSFGNFVVVYRNIVKDTTAPELNITSPKPGVRLKDNQVEIHGTVEAGANLTLGGQHLNVTGTDFIAVEPLSKEGQNLFTFTAKDAAGNVKTVPISIERDTQVKLLITAPLDGAKTKNSTVSVSGYTDSKATVNINGKDYAADSSGRFSIKTGLKVGNNDLVVKVTDDLGNTNTTTIKVNRQKVEGNPLGGMLLWVVLIVILVVVVAVVVLVMRRKKKKNPMPVDTQAMLDAEP